MMPARFPAPTLATERLILRGPEAGDWPAYRAYRLTPRSTHGGAVADEAAAWAHFAALFGHWALRGFGRFVMVSRASGGAIGHVGPFHPGGQPEPELTWTLWSAEAEGKGLAFEAAEAARAHVFRDLGWRTAVSYIAPGNRRSARLAERLGARPDPGAPLPCWAPATVWRHTAPEVA